MLTSFMNSMNWLFLSYGILGGMGSGMGMALLWVVMPIYFDKKSLFRHRCLKQCKFNWRYCLPHYHRELAAVCWLEKHFSSHWRRRFWDCLRDVILCVEIDLDGDSWEGFFAGLLRVQEQSVCYLVYWGIALSVWIFHPAIFHCKYANSCKKRMLHI